MRALGKTSGTTLLELTIAISLLAGVLGSILFVLDSTSVAYRTGSAVAGLEARAEKALTTMTQRLRQSGADGLVPAWLPAGADYVDYERATSVTDDPALWDTAPVVWGDPERLLFEYEPDDPDDGVDNDGDGLVDEGQVVLIERFGLAGQARTVLATGVRETPEGEIPGNLADDDGNGVADDRGLSFQLNGDLLTVRLTLAARDPDGAPLVVTVRRTVALRN